MAVSSYHNTFSAKYKQCKNKKDYKKLCKEMIFQFGVIDKLDENQWKIMSATLGENTYSIIQATAIKMYLLEQQGIPCEILTIESNPK